MMLKNFIQEYKWRVAPLVVAIMVLSVGYIYIYPLQSGICTPDEYCVEKITNIGEPAFAYSKWLIIAAFLTLFARETIIRRWALFAAPYLLVSFMLIVISPTSSFWGKDAIANLLGMIFVVLSFIWVGVHSLIIRHHEKKKEI